jgi:hypothetical protein
MFLGESDDDRKTIPRVIESSASGIIDDDKKNQLVKKKRKRFISYFERFDFERFHI